MGTTHPRIRRLLAEKVDDCCEEDVERRLDELHSLADEAFDDDPAQSVFAVLGNETRYRLARILATAGDDLCVCELEPFVDVSESAVSHALSDLVDAGLVTRRKEGNWRYYGSTPLAEDLFDTAAGRHDSSDTPEGRTDLSDTDEEGATLSDTDEETERR